MTDGKLSPVQIRGAAISGTDPGLGEPTVASRKGSQRDRPPPRTRPAGDVERFPVGGFRCSVCTEGSRVRSSSGDGP